MSFHKSRQRVFHLLSIVTCFMYLIIALPSFAVELPILSNVEVKANVAQKSSGIYEYSYTIKNLSATKAELRHFEIGITYPPGSIILDDQGLTNGPGFAGETSQAVRSLPDTPRMIPVGLWAPSGWVSGVARNGTAGWGSADRPFRVVPSQQLGGFAVHSYGLPGIRSFRADPWIDIDTLYPSAETMTQDQANELIKQMDKDKDVAAFKGKTLGPTAPPANFVALDFLNYIIDLKHQAATLGWITNPGVQDSLDVKLDRAKKKLQAGDTKTASNILQAFLNEVDAQGCQSYSNCPSGKHLLPEAWALLKFNAQFLLGKL